ncbi:OprD family outer membrane porin [Endozoicomonadaceae bacterium StTr2]
MKMLKLSALSAAIMAASVAHAESFIDESSFDIHLRNYYKTDKVTDAKKQSAWAQGISGSFQSGYFMNWVGLDLSFYNSFRLSGSKNRSNTGLLRLNETTGKTTSYGKVGGAIKVNMMDMATIKYGRMEMNKPLMHDADELATPSLTEGLLVEGSLMGADLYLAGARKHSQRVQSGFDSYGVKDGAGKLRKHTPWTVGADYNMLGVDMSLAYGKMHSFGHQFYGDLDYDMPLSEGMNLSMGGQYYSKTINSKAKHYADDNGLVDAGETLDEGKIYFWGLRTALSMGNLSMALAYTDVDQPGSDTKQGLDSAAMGWSLESELDQTDTGFLGYNRSVIRDFNRAGQTAWGLTVGYDMSDMIQGLDASFTYVDSDIESAEKAVKDGSMDEYNWHVNYAVPMLDGLSVHMVYAKAKQTEYDANRVKDKTTWTQKRVIVKYDVAIF